MRVAWSPCERSGKSWPREPGHARKNVVCGGESTTPWTQGLPFARDVECHFFRRVVLRCPKTSLVSRLWACSCLMATCPRSFHPRRLFYVYRKAIPRVPAPLFFSLHPPLPPVPTRALLLVHFWRLFRFDFVRYFSGPSQTRVEETTKSTSVVRLPAALSRLMV